MLWIPIVLFDMVVMAMPARRLCGHLTALLVNDSVVGNIQHHEPAGSGTRCTDVLTVSGGVRYLQALTYRKSDMAL
ncbi:MAG: hypothetical protein CISAcid_04020 [uncultured Acidilobus sp. CIS]|jgi:hypothetical protein|nr:MAG: hypothetical protein CISAcid_04020 [uncultured Acidilobus sp. CIS]